METPGGRRKIYSARNRHTKKTICGNTGGFAVNCRSCSLTGRPGINTGSFTASGPFCPSRIRWNSTPGRPGKPGGKKTRLYRMNDEENWNHAIFIENDKLKKAWYVPLYFEPEEKLLNAIVVCGLKTNRKGLLVPNIKVKQWNAQGIR
jgi:hypothetical protein